MPGFPGGDNGLVKAWGFVAGQFVLLGLLVLLPSAAPGPALDAPLLRTFGSGLFFLGWVVLVVGALSLGDSLTPSPQPRASAGLKTAGMYRFVRHPIYTGVLLIGWGMGLRSELWLGLLLALALTVWLTAKARYEEHLLSAHYPGYAAYREATPRFFPWPRRLRR
ncbi:MAG: isoprenylcysteine carboxylmethyltransferase family protein [Actinomycetes bacterium]